MPDNIESQDTSGQKQNRKAGHSSDYEVLGLEVVKPLFLQVSFLHDQCSWIGAFVGAACRSLTRAQRVFERSEWRLTSGADEGTGAFVGELRGSDFRVAFRQMSRMVD
jgi:hypothetical protein